MCRIVHVTCWLSHLIFLNDGRAHTLKLFRQIAFWVGTIMVPPGQSGGKSSCHSGILHFIDKTLQTPQVQKEEGAV